jgi:hypothetical protein
VAELRGFTEFVKLLILSEGKQSEVYALPPEEYRTPLFVQVRDGLQRLSADNEENMAKMDTIKKTIRGGITVSSRYEWPLRF